MRFPQQFDRPSFWPFGALLHLIDRWWLLQWQFVSDSQPSHILLFLHWPPESLRQRHMKIDSCRLLWRLVHWSMFTIALNAVFLGQTYHVTHNGHSARKKQPHSMPLSFVFMSTTNHMHSCMCLSLQSARTTAKNCMSFPYELYKNRLDI